ncbi:MAG: S-layer homology domain-containing protein [Oscillospiraceae bacterium]|nr:S-layer homology domain-containing protein [Oscillospiraceae bacterium]
MKKTAKRFLMAAMIAIFALAAFTASVFAADRSSVVTSGDYKVGSSIYGKALTQDQLNEVADTVASFLNEYILSDMSDVEKVAAACAYLVDSCGYADDWSKNSANTAWGALIYNEAQCSGYARAFKALCDGMGIDCHYVHADATAVNPSHQWNIVKVDDNWYHIDVQAFDDSGAWSADLVVLVSDATYTAHGFAWDKSAFPECTSDYKDKPSAAEFRKPLPVAGKPSSWAIEAVNDANRLNLCPTELLSNFRQAATRAEFCALGVKLYEFVFQTEIIELRDFDDTADINVRKMAGLGVVNGIGGNKFDPDARLTR